MDPYNKELFDQIQKLEQSARLLEPEPEERMLWLKQLGDCTDRFIGSLDQGKAYRKFDQMAGLLEVDKSGKKVLDFSQAVSELESDLLTKGLNPASGGHLGYIPGGGIYAGVLGDYLAALYNQYAGIYYGGPGAVKIENELIRWLGSLMGYPDGSLGNLTSGGSIANLIAVVTAREARGIKSREIPELCIYLTEQVHHCVHKAIRISGLGEAQIRTIGLDDGYRMDTGDLKWAIEEDLRVGLRPFMVIGTAGTTDTGAIDPLDEIADLCELYKIWFHVDAAYGGFFVLCDLNTQEGQPLKEAFKGMERSDSLAIDPHKGLFLSYGLGAVLIKDLESQYKAHYYRAAYMQDTLSSQEELSPADLSPELTKHFRGLRLWIPLRLYGIKPFVSCLEEKILLCRYFYEEIKKMGFQTGPFPQTSVCVYRYIPKSGDPNAFNQALVDKVISDGRVFVSSTQLSGEYWIRIAILSFRTHLSTIQTYLEVLGGAVQELLDE